MQQSSHKDFICGHYLKGDNLPGKRILFAGTAICPGPLGNTTAPFQSSSLPTLFPVSHCRPMGFLHGPPHFGLKLVVDAYADIWPLILHSRISRHEEKRSRICSRACTSPGPPIFSTAAL